ncbi:DUF5686 family protein [Chitinophagaceae bacterium MMS25-I14]
MISVTAFAQHVVKGTVVDEKTHQPLPFASVRSGHTSNGSITSLNGEFECIVPEGVDFLEVSYLGYKTMRVPLPLATREIALSAQETLSEVVIKPPYDKIRHILNMAISRRDSNNPDKYDAYRCRIYYKMIADVKMPDSYHLHDTGTDARELRAMLDSQHLLMTETYSIRTWRKPQHLQEDVVGSRFSGFKKNMFTNIITDALPFHAYSDYLALNGKDFHNPVSRGYGLRYEFNLNDELVQGNDTIWVLGFYPKKGQQGLKGQVYISSDNYAIAYLVATTYDEQLKRTVRIEQQYSKASGRWFPAHLNYIIDWQQKQDNVVYDVYMKGNSGIDSITYNDDQFKFDKQHTVRLQPHANELDDTAWNKLRPVALDNKEVRTYVVIDSLMGSIHADRFLPLLDKLTEAKVPAGIFDIDLKRIYSVNRYEKNRWGLGLQTNERLIPWLSVGGWAGYGTGDVHWKYGGFTEFYLDKYKETVFRIAYDNDLRDPGRVQINRDLDKNYLRRLLMYRVDEVKSYSASFKKRINYLTAEISGRYEDLTPKYEYSFQPDGVAMNPTFTAKEVSLGLRYAYAERTAPLFNRYISTGSKFPILYARVTTGSIENGSWQTSYTQTLAAVSWQKHLNRIGNERILVTAGKSWSDQPLPLSKLFAANGFLADKSALYSFGGMLTMHPYDYYTDQFVNIYWKHDFDWKLYRLQSKNFAFSSAPFLGLGHNILYGTLQHPEAQQLVKILVPDNAYHETGVMLNSIVRYNYLGVYYLTLNFGYFYHWTSEFSPYDNGRFVYGLGVEF